jgi:hypothetical protein
MGIVIKAYAAGIGSGIRHLNPVAASAFLFITVVE